MPENKLNHNGKIADYYINKLNSKVGIKIDKYVIMPNHIHLILIVENNERSIRESTLRKRSLISNTIGYLKMNISKEIHKNEYSKIIWQRSFHDHIIRNEQDYLRIWEYINTNPVKWFNDCFYVK